MIAQYGAADTFGQIAKEYIDKMVAEGRADATTSKANWLLEQLAPVARRPIADLKPVDVLAALKRITAAREKMPVESAVVLVFNLQKVLVDRADRFDRDELEIVGPKRPLAGTDLRALEELIEDLDMLVRNQTCFSLDIVAEQVAVEVFAEFGEDFEKPGLRIR